MKKVSKNQAQNFKNSEVCLVTEYGFSDADIDISVAKINGRYPDEGYCVNEQVKEMVFCLEGSGKLCTESEVINFGVGDAVLIEKGEKYYWEAHCRVAMHCYPAWSPNQHKLVK